MPTPEVPSSNEFKKNGIHKSKLMAAQLAAAGALLLSPEASAHTAEQQETVPQLETLEEKAEAVEGYFELMRQEEQPIYANEDSLRINPINFNELSEMQQSTLENLSRNTEGDRVFYEVSFTTTESPDIAATREVIECNASRVTGFTVQSLEGWASNAEGDIVGAFETLTVPPENANNLYEGEQNVELIMGLPEDVGDIDHFKLEADITNEAHGEVYQVEGGEVVDGWSLKSQKEEKEVTVLEFKLQNGEITPVQQKN